MSPNGDFCGAANSAADGLGWLSWSWFTPTLVTVLLTSSLTALFGYFAWRRQWKNEKEHERKVVATAFYREVELILKALESLMSEREDYRESAIQIREFEDYIHVYRNNTDKIGMFEPDIVESIIYFYMIVLINVRHSHDIQETMKKYGEETAKDKAREFVQSLGSLVNRGHQLLSELNLLQHSIS